MSRFGIKEGQEAKKPMPYVAPFAEGFWEGTKLGELRVQLCTKCEHKQWIPRPACEECGNRHLSWVKSDGRGRIYSFAIIRQVVMNSPAFEKEIPYALSIIELEDGVRMTAQVVDCRPEEVRIGMEVEAFFEDIGGVSVVKFRPRR